MEYSSFIVLLNGIKVDVAYRNMFKMAAAMDMNNYRKRDTELDVIGMTSESQDRWLSQTT